MTTQLIIAIIVVIFILLSVIVFFVYMFAKSDMQVDLDEMQKKSLDKNLEIFNRVNKAQQQTREKYAKLRNTANNSDTQ